MSAFILPFAAAIQGFLELVQKSQLIPKPQFDQFVTKLKGQADRLADPLTVASMLVKSGHLTTWQAKQLLRGRFRDFIVKDKHIVLEHLGTGGMSSVYLCEHIKLKKPLALKMIEIQKSEQATIQRFEREARLVFSLNHSNIVRAHDFDQDSKYLYIVMEFVDGINLHDLVQKLGPLPFDAAANYIAQAATGLQYAMEAGLIHRDIKPGNLLLNRQGVVKVLDLGLARNQSQATDGVTKQLDPEAVLGTIDYMSPEQALSATMIDIRGDIYSLGASFYYLLTGHTPYGMGTAAQKLLSHQLASPIPLTKYRSDLPKEIQRMIYCMLQKEPHLRPNQPDQVAMALQQWVGSYRPPPAKILASYCPRVSHLIDLPSHNPQSTVTTMKALTQPHTSPLKPTSKKLSKVGHASSQHIVQEVNLTISPGSTKVTTKNSRRITQLTKEPVSRKTLWIAVSLGGILTMGILSFFMLPAKQVVVQERPSTIRFPIQVSKRPINSTGSQAQYATVAEALRIARNGDQITIMDDTWQEQVNEQGLSLRGVTLTSMSDKAIRWLPPEKCVAVNPLLALKDSCGLTIRNIVFDGENRVNSLLQLSGDSSGMECTKIQFRGANQTFLSLTNSEQRSSSPPPILDNCHFIWSNQQDCTAITYESKNAGGIAVKDCLFHGKFSAVVDASSDSQQLLIENCRILGATELFRNKTSSPVNWQKFMVRHNNLHTIENLVALSRLPQADTQLQFRNNLLIDVKRCIKLDEVCSGPQKLDRSISKESGLVIEAAICPGGAVHGEATSAS